MFKIILQLVSLLFFSALFGQQIIMPILNDRLFTKQQDWGIRFLSKGTIGLAAQRLENSSINYKDELRLLQNEFGYKLVLLPVNSFGEKQREQLKQEKLVTDVATLSIYKQLKKDNLVLGFENYESVSRNVTSKAQAYVMGTMNMLLYELYDIPELQWKNKIEELSILFNFYINVIEVEDILITNQEEKYFTNNEIFWRESEMSKEIEFPLEEAFIRILSSNKLLHIGPISSPLAEKMAPVFLVYYLVFSLVILIPLSIWIIPTWISLQKLSKASNKIGTGNFSNRAAVIRGSNINSYVKSFNKMASKIEELINVNKSLVNAVSHELRTPLSRIEFDLELARDCDDKSVREKYHNKIEVSVDELKTLVNEMLTYAKFDQERPSLNIEKVDLNVWLHSELNNWQIDSSNIKLSLIASKVNQLTLLDRYYMSRVVSNICRNALKYAKTEVSISFMVNNALNKLIIEDDGPGIVKQDRDRVFEAFIRLDKSRNRESGGTGLGLAIVKQIVDWHGGIIELSESKLGGCKFTIMWPNKASLKGSL